GWGGARTSAGQRGRAGRSRAADRGNRSQSGDCSSEGGGDFFDRCAGAAERLISRVGVNHYCISQSYANGKNNHGGHGDHGDKSGRGVTFHFLFPVPPVSP